MNDLAKNLLLWGVIFVALMLAFQSFSSHNSVQPPLKYSEFYEQMKQGNVDEVTIAGQSISGALKNGNKFTTV
ncbi:MAG: ATP-dependent metallopeptidase FtsH/Yme1/Tma family protein, partial [Nevskia sp.]|nr:ATP-dependent metallopeptidase FtsH/Yme1/Tma family protein [Nevskia sp.]